MAEYREATVAVVLCHAEAAAVDALVAPGHGARTLRTAFDEALVVCAPAVATDVAREVADRIAALDDDAVVLDVSDGWAALELVGDDVADAFSYLSALPSPGPDGFVQGDVAHVGAKVLGGANGITILVPAFWGEHLRVRVRDDARATRVRG